MSRTPETPDSVVPNADASETDILTVQDRAGRRQFIRRGAAFVAAGGLVSTTGNAYADDCDRNAGEKNAQAPNTDSDSGVGADPTGCGREPDKPKISLRPNSIGNDARAPVKKIKV